MTIATQAATVFADAKRWDSAIAQTMVLRESLGRKFDGVDIREHAWLQLVAYQYAATYHGTFEFMVDQRNRLADGWSLSFSQSAAVLNCAAADWRRARPAAAQFGLPNVADVPSSRYRVVQPDGKSLSVRLDHAKWAQDKPEGTRALYYLGQGAEWQFAGFIDPAGSVRLIGREQRMAKSLTAALDVLTQSVREGRWLVHALAFSLEGSVCCFCGRELDTAESISVGYGPVCAAKYGLPWGEIAEPASVVLARDAMAHGGIETTEEPASPAPLLDERTGWPAAKANGEAVSVFELATGRKQPPTSYRPGRTYEEIFGDD